MLPYIWSVLDRRWHQNVVRTKKWHIRYTQCHWWCLLLLKRPLTRLKYSPVLEWFLHQFMSCYSLDPHLQNQKLSQFIMVMVTFFRYQYVRLDGTMSIKKRQKIVDRFNDPHVSSISTNKNDWSIYGSLDQIVIFGSINPTLSWFWNTLRFKASTT